MKMLAYIGAYVLVSKACELEREKERRRIGAAMIRTEAGIGTKEDHELIEEVKLMGRIAINRQ